MHSNCNKKKIGLFKDELNGLILKEFVGLRAKSYSLLYLGQVKDNCVIHRNDVEKQKSKGTKKSILKRFVTHHHYKTCLREMRDIKVRQNTIKSKKHVLGTYHQRRVGLSAWDTKRWVRGSGIETYAYGHYRTRTAREMTTTATAAMS